MFSPWQNPEKDREKEKVRNTLQGPGLLGLSGPGVGAMSPEAALGNLKQAH